MFGGSYFEQAAIPADLQGLDLPHALVHVNAWAPDWSRNRYGVRAGEDGAAWAARGWLFPEDPLGWFHWYCRYAAGRRHERDAHQVRRWANYGSRWGRYARGQVLARGFASDKVKQGLLQWAYEPMVVLEQQGVL